MRLELCAVIAILLPAGLACNSNRLTPDSHVAATKQWNDARVSVLSNLATDQFKQGNFEKCQQTLDQALRLQPESAPLHLLAAKLAIEQGQSEVADKQLAAARRIDPKDAEADYLNGILLQRWHQPAAARDAYAAAVEKAPEELSYLLAEAEMLVALRDPQDALTLLQGKLPAYEHSGVIRDEIGQLLIQQKKYDEAIAVLREANILAASDATIREHLAFALLSAKQFTEAGDLFHRFLGDTLYQNRADIRAALGECQSQAKQFSGACESFTAATKLNPTFGGYWLSLAKVDCQLADFQSAELAARKATSLDPSNGEAFCLLGYVRLQQNHLPEAQTAFRAAANVDPHDSVSVSMQGYLASRLGHPNEAQAFYEHALQINPHDSLANRFARGAAVSIAN